MEAFCALLKAKQPRQAVLAGVYLISIISLIYMQPSHTRRCHDNRTDMCCVRVNVQVCVCVGVCEHECVRVRVRAL